MRINTHSPATPVLTIIVIIFAAGVIIFKGTEHFLSARHDAGHS